MVSGSVLLPFVKGVRLGVIYLCVVRRLKPHKSEALSFKKTLLIGSRFPGKQSCVDWSSQAIYPRTYSPGHSIPQGSALCSMSKGLALLLEMISSFSMILIFRSARGCELPSLGKCPDASMPFECSRVKLLERPVSHSRSLAPPKSLLKVGGNMGKQDTIIPSKGSSTVVMTGPM